jgi:hypothetical protein
MRKNHGNYGISCGMKWRTRDIPNPFIEHPNQISKILPHKLNLHLDTPGRLSPIPVRTG